VRYLRGALVDGRIEPPEPLADLLERPLIGFLATQRTDGTLQCNPMWYAYDGRNLLMSHTTGRQKWRNMTENPSVSLAIADPDNTFRYLEIRGQVSGSEPDVGASFHRSLRVRYGMDPDPVPDADERVVVSVTPTFIGGRDMDDPTQ